MNFLSVVNRFRLVDLGQHSSNFQKCTKLLLSTWGHLFEPKNFLLYIRPTTYVDCQSNMVVYFATLVTYMKFFQKCLRLPQDIFLHLKNFYYYSRSTIYVFIGTCRHLFGPKKLSQTILI